MKQIATDSPLLTSGDMLGSVMGIDIKNIAHITKVLRDSIYTDKILAVVRELLSNSLDEHDFHSIQRPVETGIRAEDEGQIFFARDFALGLDEQGVRNVFSMYGNSTKSKDNRNRGAYGLGGKSPFAYSDSFFIISNHKGIKTSYSCVLGGDDEGASTGYVYKIDEQPTTDTGIEVSVPIKNTTDAEKFWLKIRNFVLFSPSSIQAIWGLRSCQPAKTTASKTISGYSFRMVETPDSKSSIRVQMGGVTYEEWSEAVGNAKVKQNHTLVIDIPIGECSVPVSREGFETTEKNEKVLSRIKEILEEMTETDLNQFKTKTVLDLVKDSLAAMTAYQGDFFQTYARNLYKGVWGFVEGVQIHDRLLPAEQKNGKPICVIIPDNDARQYWINKVKGYLRDSNRNLYIVSEKNWNHQDTAITDCFELISARKLPYPKIPKVNGRFAVYQRTRRRGRVEMMGKFNALEIFNHVSKLNQWNFVANTEKEASDFLAEKAKKVESNSDLEQIAVHLQVNGSIISVNSAAFFDKLQSLGFIGVSGQKWQEINKKLNEKREREQKKDQILSSARKHWVQYHPKTVQAINKVRNAERIGKFWVAILAEDSLRGKILKNFQTYIPSYSSTKIKRSELRKILALR